MQLTSLSGRQAGSLSQNFGIRGDDKVTPRRRDNPWVR
jgi:hypothetical protein